MNMNNDCCDVTHWHVYSNTRNNVSACKKYVSLIWSILKLYSEVALNISTDWKLSPHTVCKAIFFFNYKLVNCSYQYS